MIKFESVDIRRNNKQILDNFSFFVRKDEKVLIQGKSGIGKTSLFKALLGFETIDKGKVTFNNFEIIKDHVSHIRQQIFYLSQDIDLKNDKVCSLLEEIGESNHLNMNDTDVFKHLMQFFDLEKKVLTQMVQDLSGGERQRIGLLICFLLDRPVWLLDEPTSALDNKMKKKIADYVLDQEKTIVIISHDDVWEKNNHVRIERWG